MSKRSLFWGQASGKLGETVLYRAGGEQRTRTYVAKIKNPKTLAQVENRLSMLNFSAVYRSLKPVLSSSFPNRTTAQSGFNAFVKANKSVYSPVVTKEDALNGLCVPYRMIMSEGYLSQFGQVKTVEKGQFTYVGFSLKNLANYSEWVDAAGESGSIFSADTLKELLLGAGVPASFVLTLIVASYKDTAYVASSYKVTIDNMFGRDTFGGWSPSVTKTEDGEDMIIGFGIAKESVGENLMTTILSFKDAAGKLQITTSQMVGTSVGEEYGAQFVKGGEYYEDVLNSYGFNEGSVLG